MSATPGARSTTAWAKPSGFVGGVQGGYNWQTGHWVFGLEGDIQASGANDTFAPWKFSNPWFGTVRGRGGYAFNNILFYGTRRSCLRRTARRDLWPVGIPHQCRLDRRRRRRDRPRRQNWSAKVEYLYVDLASSNFAITGVSNGYSFGTFRAGVNYRF